MGAPRLAPGGAAVGWLTGHLGRGDVVVAALGGSGHVGPPLAVTSDPTVSASVHHGGGFWCWGADAASVVIAARDGTLWRQPVDAMPPQRLQTEPGATAPSARGDLVAYLRGDDEADAICLLDNGRDGGTTVADRADFHVDPDVGADGTVVWHEWDIPAMAWHESRIMLRRHPDTAPLLVDGGDGIACSEPRLSPDGSALAWISDRAGSWSVWTADTADPVGTRRLTVEGDTEIGGPTWGPGARSYAWAPDGRAVAYATTRDGATTLAVQSLDGGDVRVLCTGDAEPGLHTNLSWDGDRVCALYSDASTPPRVRLYDPSGRAKPTDVTAATGAFAGIGVTRHVSVPSPDGDVHALVTLPSGAGGPVPLVVSVHGGPVGQADRSFHPDVAFLVSRGYGVLRVNHRGSTGYGRVYRDALRGRWGEVDADDAALCARAMVDEGVAAPGVLAVMGGSAGGYTTLQCLVRHPGLFAAGIVRYGVTDLFRLAATTHRFERHEQAWLVGELPGAEALWRERSPGLHPERIDTPLLVTHGTDDPVVPFEQSLAVVESLRSRGVPVEHVAYEGQGHGWSAPDVVIDEYERIEAFLARFLNA